MDPQLPNKLIATKYCFLDDTSFFFFFFIFFFFFLLLLLLLFYVIINLKYIYIYIFYFLSLFLYEFFFIFSCSGMFRNDPGCSGMFRNVPCSGFYRRPSLWLVMTWRVMEDNDLVCLIVADQIETRPEPIIGQSEFDFIDWWRDLQIYLLLRISSR